MDPGPAVAIHTLVARARERLRQAGIPDAEADLDVRLIAQSILGWDSARFFTAARDEPPALFAARYRALVARRAAREPLAYVLGLQEFWGLTFEVTPSVLIPRPETEGIVEAVLDLFPARDAAIDVADVGTGSGCLAVAVGHERPHARIVAVDLSEAALVVARINAQRHHVIDRVTPIHGDLFDPLGPPAARFDAVVSNPPYVPAADRSSLQPEVRDHEPATALFAGADGLNVIRRLIPGSVPFLKPAAYLVFELGAGQDRAVRELIEGTSGLSLIDIRHDLQGIPRTAIAQRQS